MSRFTATVTATGNARTADEASNAAIALVADLRDRYGRGSGYGDVTFTVASVVEAPVEVLQVHSVEMTDSERASVERHLASLRA